MTPPPTCEPPACGQGVNADEFVQRRPAERQKRLTSRTGGWWQALWLAPTALWLTSFPHTAILPSAPHLKVRMDG